MSSPKVQSSGSSSALVVKIKLRQELTEGFSAWHARMTTAPAGTSGFISAEVNGPSLPGGNDWSVIQHFRTLDQTNAWRGSKQHRVLIRDAQAFVDLNDPQGLCEEARTDAAGNGIVTEVVTTYVKPGKDHEYQRWAEKVHAAEAEFEGYCGGFLQPPATAKQHYWTTLVRFASPDQLDAWLNSSVRQDLLREHEALVSSWEHHRLPTAFAGWFPTDTHTGESPKSWKQSLLVLLMLFPIVMLEIKYLGRFTRGLGLAQQTFISNLISVFLLAWLFMPLIISVMKWWLLPGKNAPRWVTPAGIALLLALYVLEVTAFAFF